MSIETSQKHSAEARPRAIRRLLKGFRGQLLLSCCVVVLILALMISFLYFASIRTDLLDRQAGLLKEQAAGFQVLLQGRVESIQSDALSVLNNATIREYLSYPYNKAAYKVNDALYGFQPLVSWVQTINAQYSRIHFLTTSKYTSGDPYVDSLDDYLGQPWVTDTIAAGMQGYWQNLHEAVQFRYAIKPTEMVATYSLYTKNGGERMAILDTDAQWLYQGVPFVADAQTGLVLYSEERPEAVGQRLTLHQQESISSAEVDGAAYYVHAASDEALGVIILSCVDELPIRQEIHRRTLDFACWAILFVVGTMILLAVATGTVVYRMKAIRTNVSEITRGNYDVRYEAKKHDEIDELGDDVVSMAKQMNQMVNQRLNQQMLLREAEFRALQHQINPHFIFNILQTIQIIAESNEQTELAHYIAQFGRLVRYNLFAGGNVQLYEELDNIKNYVALQNLMYNDSLLLNVNGDCIDLDIEMPRLLLQPLVENAIQHGKIKGRMLVISVSVQREGSDIVMRVSNDGHPLTDEQAASLDGVLEDVRTNPGKVDGVNAKDNLALINIQKRLLIRFGSECRLRILNSECGVSVSFAIPEKDVTL